MVANQNQDCSVHIGGTNILVGSALIAGDSNTVLGQFQEASLPQSGGRHIYAELKVLQSIFVSRKVPVTTSVAQKLEEEISKTLPDISMVATTLETGLTYARNLAGFSEANRRVLPHVAVTAGWFGGHDYKLPLLDETTAVGL